MSPSNSNIAISNGGGSGDSNSSTGKNYIEHQVSKRDTLAGVAIKYGVEVGVSLFLNLGFFSCFILMICLISWWFSWWELLIVCSYDMGFR